MLEENLEGMFPMILECRKPLSRAWIPTEEGKKKNALDNLWVKNLCLEEHTINRIESQQLERSTCSSYNKHAQGDNFLRRKCQHHKDEQPNQGNEGQEGAAHREPRALGL